MDSPAILCIRAGMFTCAGRYTLGETDLGALKFCATLCGFRSVPAHAEAFAADRDAIISDGEIILVNRWSATLAIEVNEGPDSMITAVFVVSHCIMCGIKQEFVYMCFRKILLHGKPVVHEAMRVVPGSRSK